MDELDKLKRFKERNGWTYGQLADAMGLHYRTVEGWFIGKYKPGNLARHVICEFLDREKKGKK